MSIQSAPKPVYVFGTSGYRHDDDAQFNEAVVRQITESIGDYLLQQAEKSGQLHPILIGGDTREKTRRFIPKITEWLLEKGFDVYQATGDVPTPVLAYVAKYFNELVPEVPQTAGCILMTASHNPWNYGGYNFLTPDAAVVPSSVSKEFEALQLAPLKKTADRKRFALAETPQVKPFDPYAIYQRHLKEGLKIDYQAIKDSGLALFYDPLYATGRNYFPRLLKAEGIEVLMIHGTDDRPAAYTGMPEPSGPNLLELGELVRQSGAALKLGLANDGDSDRFGVLDENGQFVAPGDVLALVLYHLINNRNAKNGVVVRSQATTHLLDAIASAAGLETQQTPVGYKYIAEEFIEREQTGHTPVLLGGESSGGLSIGGHIPEKDGLLANLLIAELVAVEKRPLSQILKGIRDAQAKKFAFVELAIKTPDGKMISEGYAKFRQSGGNIADLPVDIAKSQAEADALQSHFKTTDGVKLYLQDGSWVLIRISGTEPLARVCIETMEDTDAKASQTLERLLAAVTQTLVETYDVSPDAIKRK